MTSVTLGPRPGAPRPHAEAPLARRTALVALAFLAASALHLAWRGVDLAQLQRAFPLYALGGFSVLIFGTMRLLISGMAGRDVAGGAFTSVATVTLGAAGALLVYLLQDGALAWLGALVWGAAAAVHVGTIAATVRRRPARPAIVDPLRHPRTALPLRVLEAGSLAYAAAAAVLVPLAYAGVARLATAIHVVLVGFVIVTIMGTAIHILPRFTRTSAPPAWLYPLALAALVGPGLTAYGATRRGALLQAGALVEGVAFALFGVLVATLLLRAHQRRAHHLAYLAAPLSISVGGILALLYAFDARYAAYLDAHGLLNVYGFAGLTVIAASTDLYGPALATGAASARRHALLATLLTLGGLVVAAVGAFASPLAARTGILLFALGVLWQLAGVLQTHRRAERVVSRLRRA